jgi:hypothetical protein
VVNRNHKEHDVNDTAAADHEFERYQRELALVDQIIGLQAALAQESVRNSPSRQRVEALETEIKAIKRSLTWRIGRLATAPMRVARRLSHRIGA